MKQRNYIVTWDRMKSFLDSQYTPLTITEITDKLGAERMDVYYLLLLMEIAEEVRTYKLHGVLSKFYESINSDPRETIEAFNKL